MDLTKLLSIIDSRVRKIFKKTSSKFPAKVVSVIDSGTAIVRLSNDDVELTLLNKTGEILSAGDSVYIETIDGNMTGGFISERFGIPVLAGGGTGSMTPGDILSSIKTVDGSGSGLDADLLDGQHGTYYLSRTNHTGTQSADTIIDGTTNKVFTATEKTKLSGIATGATANDTDANLINRANHTGTQAATTVTVADTGSHFTATDVEGALVELFTSVSNGKALVADAITDKGVATSASDSFSTMATNISTISSGEAPTTGQYLIRFIDYDGTILKEARADSGDSVTAPSDPVHDGLTFQGWNYDSSAYTNVTADLDVGAIYVTTDGKTRLKIRLTTVSGLSPTLYFNKSDTSILTILWGDGTSDTSNTSGNQNKVHTYATIGDYTIEISITSGTGTYGMGNGTGSTTFVGGSIQTYRNTLMEIFIGDNVVTIGSYSFYYCKSLSYITIPNNVTSIGTQAFRVCSSLSFITIPNSIVNINTYAFTTCYSLINISIPVSITSINNYLFQLDYSIKKLIFSSNITSIGTNVFQSCLALKTIIFYGVTPPTLSDINAFSEINTNTKIYVPDTSVSAYKTATNWATYADYIYPISEI